MKKYYEEPKVAMMKLQEDVITTSPGAAGGDVWGDGWQDPNVSNED